MTGEITLTGQVLPIGGVRDKVLAAQRAGLGRVILPRENEPDLEELPSETREALRFVLVDSIDEVFDAAFSSNGATGERSRATGGCGKIGSHLHPRQKGSAQMVSTTKERAAAAAASARPYVERALRDKELRDNIRNAYTSARAVYDELASRRKVSDAASRLAGDKDIQDEMRNAIDEIRNAAGRVKDVKQERAGAGAHCARTACSC